MTPPILNRKAAKIITKTDEKFYLDRFTPSNWPELVIYREIA